VNSIVLSHEDYEQFQLEWMDSLYEGDRPITKRVEEAGVNVNGFSGLCIENKPYGVIVSNERVQEPKGIYLASQVPLVKDLRLVWNDQEEVKEPEVNKTEAMNIFNELLVRWVSDAKSAASAYSKDFRDDIKEINESAEEYRKRFAEALGVPYEES
jgi:hypothetical protein